jgi:hypothetical protein
MMPTGSIPIDFAAFFRKHTIPNHYGHPVSVMVYYDADSDCFYWASPAAVESGSITIGQVQVTNVPLPILGTVTVLNPVTDVSISNTPLPVTGSVAVTNTPLPINGSVEAIPPADYPSNDAFSRLRVSNPQYRFDSQFSYKINPDFWDTSYAVGSSVTQNATERWVVLQTGTGSSQFARLQSHYHSPYTPGRSQLVFITGLFGTTPASGSIRRMGYRCISQSLGIYLEQTSTSVNFVIDGGTSLGTQRVSQSSWNVDKFDGTGPSKKILDLSKVQIFVLDFQALYAGRVRCGFDIDGVTYWGHQFLHANNALYSYIQIASQPLSWEVISTATPTTMNALCGTVMSEGGADLFSIPGNMFGVSNGITGATISTRTPLLTIRVKKTFNGITYNGVIVPEQSEFTARTNPSFIELVRNGILTGATIWSDVNTNSSATEFNTDATGIASGSVIATAYVVSNGANRLQSFQNLLGKLVLSYSHLLDIQDTLSVVATSLTGNSQVNCSIDWKEVR